MAEILFWEFLALNVRTACFAEQGIVLYKSQYHLVSLIILNYSQYLLSYFLSFLIFSIHQEMNVSSANVTVVIEYRDSLTKAVIKNVIVLALSISINYINAGLIRTFYKHQVWRFSHFMQTLTYEIC